MPETLTDPRQLHGAKNLELISRLRRLFNVARDAKRARYNTWIRNYRLVNNQFGGGNSSWMPAPKDSEIYPTLSALVGWMTDQNTQIQLTPATDPYGPYYDMVNQKANDLSTVYYSTWQTENYNAQIKLALWDEFLYGAGVIKSVWDNALAGGMGNAVIRRVDPWAWYVDPNATSELDMEYCVEVRRMSRNEIERRFPDAYDFLAGGGGGENIDERPQLFQGQSTIPMTGAVQFPNSNVSLTYAKSRGAITDPLPGYVVYEFWIRENSEWYDDPTKPALSERHIYDRWRVIVMCENTILMDKYADEIFSHGQQPYDRMVFDDVGEFYGISLVDHLAHPAIYINRLLTALQHNAELTGNPIFLDVKNSGLDRTPIVNRPGQRLSINATAANAGMGPKWLEPPTMPGEVSDLIEFWISRIENVSGLSAIVRGATPTARNAEGVISSIQEAAFVRIRSGLANLEATLRSSSYKNLDNIIDFYTEPRIVGIIGPDGEMTAKSLHAQHFNVPTPGGKPIPLRYLILVQAGASAPTSRQARIAEADQLGAIGIVDDEYVLQAHQIPHAKEILARKYDKMQKGLFAPAGARQRAGRSS